MTGRGGATDVDPLASPLDLHAVPCAVPGGADDGSALGTSGRLLASPAAMTMNRSASCTVFLLAALVSEAPLCAQAERENAFGTVQRADGSPWSGARVILRSRPVALLELGAVDTIETATDERGRFRAGLLPWRSYTAWACGDADANGRYAATNVVQGVVARSPVQLTEGKTARWSGTLAIEGLERWKDLAPFRFLLASKVQHEPEQGGVVGERGEIAIPKVPGDRARLELLGRGDVPIHAQELELAALPRVVQVPEPSERPFAVLTQDGNPVGAARYVATWRGRAFEVGRLDGEGKGVLRLPATCSDADYRLLSAGSAPAILIREDGDAAWSGKLVHGSRRRGRLMIRDGVPAANWPLWLNSGSYNITKKSHFVGSFDLLLHTDAQGRFATPDAVYAVTLWTVPAEADRDKLPEAWRGGVHPLLCVAHHAAQDGKDVDLGDLVLADRLWLAELCVTHADGRPAIGAQVGFGPARGGVQPTDVWTDRKGQARVLLPIEDLTLVATCDDAWGVQGFTVEGKGPGSLPLAVRLCEPRYLSGRLMDVTAPGARIRLWAEHVKPAVMNESGLEGARGENLQLLPGDKFEPYSLQNLINGGLNRFEVRTDAEGRFRFPIPNATLTFQVGEQIKGSVVRPVQVEHDGKSIEGVELPSR